MSVDDATVSSLAITEKRPSQSQRPGGCVGIFFQLLDWHRRFAKKKLFSGKLLPPARPRRLKGDEKMPAAKLHLIADENKGGFPNFKKNGARNMESEPRRNMRAPGLVARLMGLESMPTVRREKVKKTEREIPQCEGDRFTPRSNGSSDPAGEDLYKEKGQIKHELRPKKLQKTGPSERRAVTRFGAEALQIKDVLSRSRKHHHPKLLSPVKSPRVPSVKNGSRTSRLIDAAAKILEPGLQSKSRTKCAALTYSAPSYNPPGNEVIRERLQCMPPDTLNQSSCEVAANSSMGQTSCKNCGKLVDFADTSSDVEGMTSSNTSGSPSSRDPDPYHQASAMNNPRQTACAVENEVQVHYKRRQEECTVMASGMTYKSPVHSYNIKDVKSGSAECLELHHLSSEKLNLQKNGSTSMAIKSTSQANRMSMGGDSIRPGAKSYDLKSKRVSSLQNTASGRKDFIALNRSLSGQARPRVPAKVDKPSIGASRKYSAKRDDTSASVRPPVQKTRTMDVTEPMQSANFVCSSIGRQRDARRSSVQGRGVGRSIRSNDEACSKRQLVMEGKGINSSSSKNSGVVSFTFNSPLRQKNVFSTETHSRISEQNDSVGESTPEKGLVLEFSDDKASQRNQCPLSGDALGALLEKKLKELLSQEDEVASAGYTPKRSTAAILQELIAALTAEPSLSLDSEISHSVEAKEKREIGCRPCANHFSPGSVLDASFSSDSCMSSSMDDTPGRVSHPDMLDYSQEHVQISGKENLLDSAASFDEGMTHHRIPTDFMESVTTVISSVNPSMLRDAGIKLSHAQEVILHTELLLANLTQAKLDSLEQSVISTSLIDKLEHSATTSWRDINRFCCTKMGYRLREFLFDCLVECLDLKYHPCCHYGYEGWTKQALYLNVDMLIQAVKEEVRKWIALSYMTPEEIIELEMSHSLGKWTDFDIEAFECGVDIEGDLLKNLIDEIVADIWQCRTTS